MLTSNIFTGAERISRFLDFAVNYTLEAPQQSLKEIVIGNELYATKGDFDPRLSAVVRVDANRLRAKLREYYAAEGASDPMEITLPKGAYTPVFRSVAADTAPPAIAEPAPPEPSIAVLPFSNLSPDPSDYFSDGLTEEIIHALSSIGGMRVVARTSCFALKYRNADVRDIGRTLSVQFVLEGSVRKSDDALRVTVRLVSASDGYQLWSRRYDHRADDLFALQDDIAREVVSMLRAGQRHPSKAAPQRVASSEAYAWYLRGRYHLNRQTRESLYRAVECFDHAIHSNPEYPAAISACGFAWLFLGLFAMDRPLEVLPKAYDAAARALAIDSNWGEALSISACARAMFEHQWHEAERLFRQAVEIEPGSEMSKHLLALFALLPLARMDEALEVIDQATQLDPLSAFVSSTKTAILLMSRRWTEAEKECRRALELDSGFWRAVVGLGRCYEAAGRFSEAIECYERATVLSDRVPSSIGALGRAYALTGQQEHARKLLNELDGLAQNRYVSPYSQALIYLGLGDERVFEYLERSYADRAGWLMFLATDPRFDDLRSDSRFQAFLHRLRLPANNFARQAGTSGV